MNRTIHIKRQIKFPRLASVVVLVVLLIIVMISLVACQHPPEVRDEFDEAIAKEVLAL